jgi:hypothetical protein
MNDLLGHRTAGISSLRPLEQAHPKFIPCSQTEKNFGNSQNQEGTRDLLGPRLLENEKREFSGAQKNLDGGSTR